jgi:hypothetical protein
MRQIILTYVLLISSAASTIAIFHLTSIVPLVNGMSVHFKPYIAKHHSL